MIDEVAPELTEPQVMDLSDPAALLARMRRLEKRQEIQADLASRALLEEVGRAAQSIGVIVDYLAERGLIAKADLHACLS